MAVRQYIGARYVPRFLGTYDATTIYEALDVVDNGLGTSYIARKTVPAGTSLLDTNYWFVYGASSGAIINLQNRVNNLDNEVAKLATDRKFVLIGDSFSVGVTESGQPWTTGWADYMHNIFPDQVFYDGQGGGGAGFTIQGNSFLDCLNSIYSALTENPYTITDVVVLGGTNEGNTETESSIATAIDTFCAASRNLFPNADISIGIVGLNARRMVNTLQTYKGYRTGASRNGAKFLSDAVNLGTNPAYATQNGHWTVAGYNLYNPYIAQLIVSGHCHFYFNWVVNLTLNANAYVTPSSYSPRVDFSVTEKGVRLKIYDPNFGTSESMFLTNKILIAANRTQAIFDFPAGTNIYAAFSLGYIMINGNAWYIDTTAKDTQFCAPIGLTITESGGDYKITMSAALPLGAGSKSADSNYISMISHEVIGLEVPISGV